MVSRMFVHRSAPIGFGEPLAKHDRRAVYRVTYAVSSKKCVLWGGDFETWFSVL